MVRISISDLHRTIWEIMKAGDLNTLTAKKIRSLCEKKYKTDLTDRKTEIDDIVMAYVKKYCDESKAAKHEKDSEEEKSDESAASDTDSEPSDDTSDSEPSDDTSDSEPSDDTSDDEKPSSPIQVQQKSSPAKKIPAKNNVSAAAKKKKIPPTKAALAPKRMKNETSTTADIQTKNSASVSTKKKKVQPAELDDEALARKLQAEEFSFRRATVERGFRNTSKKVKTKTEATKKSKKASPFMKKCVLSPALAEVIGETEMSRPDVVQRMWSIVRERNLFDESNKQFALCDEQLTKLFGKKRVRLIGMMKYLKHHIKDIQ